MGHAGHRQPAAGIERPAMPGAWTRGGGEPSECCESSRSGTIVNAGWVDAGCVDAHRFDVGWVAWGWMDSGGLDVD